jgi:hypothetical protein
MGWWWWSVACSPETPQLFVEPPGECVAGLPPTGREACLVVPTLRSCAVDVASDATSGVNGERWEYDAEGRLVRFSNGPNVVSTDYEWEGSCLRRVGTVPVAVTPLGSTTGATSIVVEHECDRHGQPITEVVTEVEADGRTSRVLEQYFFENRYDSLDQLSAYDIYAEGGEFVFFTGLSSTWSFVWDGQGRVARHEFDALDGGPSNTRDFQWDQLRMLGWIDRTDGRDPSMQRTFEGDRLVEQRLYVEEDLTVTTRWEYPERGPWPIRREIADAGGGTLGQGMSVSCEE